MENKLILIVEDEEDILELLEYTLQKDGYETIGFLNVDKNLEKVLDEEEIDLILMDRNLPGSEGTAFVDEIKAKGYANPVIYVTAKDKDEDILEGFESHADDYITKPFSMEELLARITAVLRRSSGSTEKQEQTEFSIGNYKFDYKKRALVYGEHSQKLTSKENDLLRLLCLNEGKVLERTYALKAIWEDDTYFNARSMDVYIAKLRKHLKQDETIEIMNVHGRGFRFLIHKKA